MLAISLTGGPGPRRPSMIITLALIIAVVLLLGGCETKQYRSVPLCELISPPQPTRYVDASPDEQTIMMTDVYIAQIKATSECNDNIGLVNASNKAK
ncbi:hypothetical protein D9M68_18350 [compost metagenome]